MTNFGIGRAEREERATERAKRTPLSQRVIVTAVCMLVACFWKNTHRIFRLRVGLGMPALSVAVVSVATPGRS